MKRGFTFIEIVVAISILALLALLLANILPRAFDIFNEKFEEQERFSNVQIIFDRLAREIRQGISISQISSPTQSLGYLVLNFSSGGSISYSTTLYNGKYYFTVDNEIQAGPIQELRFVGLDTEGTYTTLTSNIRTLSITVVMENGQKYASTISLRAETLPAVEGIFITEIMYYPAPYDRGGNSPDERDMEFIVIYNGTTYTVNIEGWRINRTTRISDSIIPGNNDFNLPPGKYAIIGGRNSSLDNSYYLPFDYYYFRTQQRGLYRANGEIPDTSGEITIEDKSNRLLDSVNYSYTWGGYPSGTRYYSLVKRNIIGSSNDPSNWMSNLNLNYSITVGSNTYYSYCLRPRFL